MSVRALPNPLSRTEEDGRTVTGDVFSGQCVYVSRTLVATIHIGVPESRKIRKKSADADHEGAKPLHNMEEHRGNQMEIS